MVRSGEDKAVCLHPAPRNLHGHEKREESFSTDGKEAVRGNHRKRAIPVLLQRIPESYRKGRVKLPKGQLTHICRHTFASHFIMNGGYILTLQKVLGHSDLKLTMRYAHLSPDYLNDVVTKGPALMLMPKKLVQDLRLLSLIDREGDIPRR